MTDSEFVFVYSTFPDDESAKRVAEALVREKLAACVNIHGPMTSIYEWQGKLETGPEFAAFIKTRRALVGAVTAAARPLTPCPASSFCRLRAATTIISPGRANRRKAPDRRPFGAVTPDTLPLRVHPSSMRAKPRGLPIWVTKALPCPS
jgi:periplasmic divalent cation tolerance protein